MLDLFSQQQFRVNEVKLVYKSNDNPKNQIVICNPDLAYEVLKSDWDMNRIELLEQFKIILLNRNHTCLGISEISTGGMAGCIVDPKIVFATALKARAPIIMLAHNHPSGNLVPSKQDIDLTKKLVLGGKLLDIAVIEHLIVTKHGYTSMARKGYFPG
jgi:DNA repair protein RadC